MPDAVIPWPPCGSALAVHSGDVHVWRCALDGDPSRVDHMLSVLSPDERTQASRFFFERDRNRFVTTRGALRRLLGRYLDVPPDTIAFDFDRRGKPTLANPSADLQFNVSHSGTMALLAFARERRVGVDVECIRDDVRVQELASHFFSADEALTLQQLPAEARVEAFFIYWTRKESYLKARGTGLAGGLDKCPVSLPADRREPNAVTLCDPRDGTVWTVQGLWVGDGYSAALTVEGSAPRVGCYSWS